MEFTCKTLYNQKAMTVMARALRKTIRKSSSKKMRTASWITAAISLVCMAVSLNKPWLAAANGTVAVLLVLLVWKEDTCNAFFARRKGLPGTSECTAVFRPDCYETQITGALTRWQYDRVLMMAETEQFIVFILGRNHAQAYDKAHLSGGTEAAFRSFLEERTGKTIEKIGGQTAL